MNESTFNRTYSGERLSRVAFPLGGIGAGMIGFEGVGALSHVSVRNRPEVFNEPCTFAALCIKGDPAAGRENVAKVLEGPVPTWKVFGRPGTGNGAGGTTYGLPRYAAATFKAEFPFARVRLTDDAFPVEVEITGWSPFIPGDADASSLPLAALEYRFVNTSERPVEAVFSFNSRNFMATRAGGESVRRTQGGFILDQPGTAEKPQDQGAFCAVLAAEPTARPQTTAQTGSTAQPPQSTAAPEPTVNCAWFRGGWFDALSIAWKQVLAGDTTERPPVSEGKPSPGGSLMLPIALAPGERKTVRLMFSWYVPVSDLRTGDPPPQGANAGAGAGAGAGDNPASCDEPQTYRPWYAGRFEDIEAVAEHWRAHYDELRTRSKAFSECFFDSTLPPEVLDAVSANLTILKSPTVLRQTDGRLWCWEGCSDNSGCCAGTCTHVWNYAQALPHLFPDLERTLRETEFGESQDARGHQVFRALIPIRTAPKHDFHAAVDGQLGGLIKLYREWRISGDTEWLRSLWPKARQSLNYCIDTWDPGATGLLREPQHNTYDIEFWGPNGMLCSFYLAALSAFVRMGEALGEDVSAYRTLAEKGRAKLEAELYNGEYFIQRIEWKTLKAGDPTAAQSFHTDYSPEARALLEAEGPKYQYGEGCLSDGVLGFWLAAVSGLDDELVDPAKLRSNLHAIYRYNLKEDLSAHANPQRPSYAVGREGGLLLCTWPKGGRLSLPFVYSDEVWTGIEYQVASHLMLEGMVEEGLKVVRTCRARYDGRVRNPFNEYECGHWYARAMASYALLYGLTGVRYDAVEKRLTIRPRIKGDFRSFFATQGGFGTVGVKDGKPFAQAVSGQWAIDEIVFEPCQ